MKLYDRLKLTEDYKLMNGFILKKDTIGTCRSIDEEHNEYTLQMPMKINEERIMTTTVSISDLLLERATEEDLIDLLKRNEKNYEFLTPKIFHINNIWSIKTGYNNAGEEIYKCGLIIDYKMKLNENDDEVVIKFFDDEVIKTYKKRYVNLFGSYSLIF